VKGVQELYNSEGRKNVKHFILILGSKGPTRNVLLTDDKPKQEPFGFSIKCEKSNLCP
jgi:hypothetical protein